MDREMVGRLVGGIRDSLRVAEEMVGLDPATFLGDVRNRYTLRLALVEVVEASAALGLHILRDLGERGVDRYAQVFERFADYGVVSRDVGEGMKRLVGLRNLIIPRYWEVDDGRIYREARGEG